MNCWAEITVIIGPPEVTERTPREEVESLLRAELARGGKARDVARRVQSAMRKAFHRLTDFSVLPRSNFTVKLLLADGIEGW